MTEYAGAELERVTDIRHAVVPVVCSHGEIGGQSKFIRDLLDLEPAPRRGSVNVLLSCSVCEREAKTDLAKVQAIVSLFMEHELKVLELGALNEIQRHAQERTESNKNTH